MAGCLTPEQAGLLNAVAPHVTALYPEMLLQAVREATPQAGAAAVTTGPIRGAPLHPEEVVQPISGPPQPTGTGVTMPHHGVHSLTVAPAREALPTQHRVAAHHLARDRSAAAPAPAVVAAAAPVVAVDAAQVAGADR